MTAYDYRVDDTTAAATVLREASAAYEVATSNWRQQLALGGIVELDPTDAVDAISIKMGARYKSVTTKGSNVLMKWQRARAEVLDALKNRRHEIERRL